MNPLTFPALLVPLLVFGVAVVDRSSGAAAPRDALRTGAPQTQATRVDDRRLVTPDERADCATAQAGRTCAPCAGKFTGATAVPVRVAAARCP